MSDTLEIFGTEYTGVTGIKATDDQSGTKVYIRPQGNKAITQNGTGIDVVGYSTVSVAVPNDEFIISLSYDDSEDVWEPDCTFAEAYAAYNEGKTIAFTASKDDGGYELILPCSGSYISRNSTFAYSVSDSFNDWSGNNGYVEKSYFFNSNGVTFMSENTFYETAAADPNYDGASPSDVASGKTFYNSNGYQVGTNSGGGSPTIQSLTVTPSTSQQVFNASGVDGYKPVTVNAMPSGTAGTPIATKGTVTNHSVSVTPSVTNTTGYITGSTKTGTAVTVSASELVSGSETKTANGTYDVTNLASLVVNVPSGSSKNVQVLQSTSRTNSSSLTKVLGDLTVSKTGTYDIYWSGGRTNTSTSYTWGTRLYVDGTGYGTENTTWTNNCQSNHLSNVSLTANQKLSVYARGRSGSYYTFAPMLVIIEA